MRENLLKSVRKKLFFYNEEGRGLFDEINDIYENHCEYPRAYLRLLSSSIALKVNNSEEYRYLLNFENMNNNFDFIDIKTGEIQIDNIFNYLFINHKYEYLDIPVKPSTQLLELNEKNQFLIAAFVKYRHLDDICIFYCIISLEEQKNNKIDINSLKIIEQEFIYIEF